MGSILKEVLTRVGFLESGDSGLFPRVAQILSEHVVPPLPQRRRVLWVSGTRANGNSTSQPVTMAPMFFGTNDALLSSLP